MTSDKTKYVDTGMRISKAKVEHNKEFLSLTVAEQAKKIRGYKHFRSRMSYVPEWMDIDTGNPDEVRMAKNMSLKQKFPHMKPEPKFSGTADGCTIIGKGLCIHGLAVREIDDSDTPIVGKVSIECRQGNWTENDTYEVEILDVMEFWVELLDPFERVWQIIEL